MPTETAQAVSWALQQTITDQLGKTAPITKDNPMALVDAVRQYFSTNNITYSTFSFSDLASYL